MEQPITIVALALSIAGLSYLKVQQIERLVMAEEAAIAQAIQDSTAARFSLLTPCVIPLVRPLTFL